ncbi:invasion associated locus B family protein [Bartonella sp. CB175]|uniref:invasion associated locus B family protein n=1 Tax=Bartonella sp. CB175 TaxID=3112256 RepID=UPI00300DD88E
MTTKKISKIIKNKNILAKVLFIFVLLCENGSFADTKNSIYTVHPPRLSVPRGAPGETRRIITQFYNWTLICDEKKSLHQGICNVTQAIHDQEDHTIFSWSLVSTKSGQAVMLFRTLPKVDKSVPIKMFIDGVKKPILIRYTQCNQKVCLAQLSMGSILREQIEQNKSIRIAYKVKGGKLLSFTVPLKGLSAAVQSLQR